MLDGLRGEESIAALCRREGIAEMPVFVYRVGKAHHFNAVELGQHDRNRTNVWDYASVKSLAGSRREDWPCTRPSSQALVADAIQDAAILQARRRGWRRPDPPPSSPRQGGDAFEIERVAGLGAVDARHSTLGARRS